MSNTFFLGEAKNFLRGFRTRPT